MSTTTMRQMFCKNVVLWAAVACLSAGGCFRSVDPTKVKCADDKNCPRDFTCSKQRGTCVSGTQQPFDSGIAGSGGSTQPQSTGGAGGSSWDGGGGGAGSGGAKTGVDGGSSSDVPMTPEPSCTSDTDCSTGHCVDGVCCDSACDGQCESCREAGSVGICKAVKGDPVAPRTACGGTGSCKGQCDGNSGKACAYPGDSTVCAAAKCEGGKVTTASLCNSAGACSSSTSSTCPNSQCATDGSAKCASSCTPTSCAAGAYCDTTGACLPAQANSSSCSSGQQCSSGYCVDGVCCDSKCDGQCQSCKETGSVGKCKAVKGDPITTRAACGGAGICKGQCDGTGVTCAFPTDSSVCTQASCTVGKATSASVCNGSGACTTATTNQCTSNLCGTDGKCSGSCTASSCSAGTYCDSTGACAKTIDNGAKCSSAGQCTSGNCVDGVCCDGKCDGNCESCSTGTCAFTATPRKPCDGSGKCAGTCDKANPKTCTYPGSSITCSDQTCSAGVRTDKSVCDGKGVCPAATTTKCDTNLCSGADCSGSCTVASCGTGMYCAGTTCASVKNQGDGCSSDAECSTNHCVDGYCCESACTGTCTICSATRGKCTNTTTARGGKSCGGSVTCAGYCGGSSPDCSFPGSSTPCGQTSCASGAYQPVGSCDGSGSCSMPQTQTCPYVCSASLGCVDCNPNVDTRCDGSTGAPQNCSSSGHWQNGTACPGGQICSGSATNCVCPSSKPTKCGDGACYDTTNDNAHCGSLCQNCSQSGKTCSNGTCGCPFGQMDCGSGCVDVLASNAHCGGCATTCTQAGYTCGGGSCSCTGKLVANCGCLAWNFNNNDSQNQGWGGPGGGVRGQLCTYGQFGTEIPEKTIVTAKPPSLDGTGALYLDMTGDGGSCGAGAGVGLCSNGVDLTGLTFSAKFVFEPFSGSSAYTGSIDIFSTGTASGATDAPHSIPAGQWTTVSATIPDQYGQTDSQFGILFFPGSWAGRVWIDNITIK